MRRIQLLKMQKVHGWGRRLSVQSQVSSSDYFDFSETQNTTGSFSIVGGKTAYGDSFLSASGLSFSTERMKDLSVDSEKLVAICGAGVSFRELIKKTLPMGLIPVVIPGTPTATLGGAVAVDAHGKSLSYPNCMSNAVIQFDLLTDFQRVTVKEEDELYSLTLGGLGLTGLVDRVHVPLKAAPRYMEEHRLRFSDLSKLQDFMLSNRSSMAYQVSIIRADKHGEIDALLVASRASNQIQKFSFNSSPLVSTLGRLLFILKYSHFSFIHKRIIQVGIDLQFRQAKKKTRIISLKRVLFPLDIIRNWNCLHGRSGLTQWQRVIPFESTSDLNRIVTLLLNSKFKPTLITLKSLHEYSKATLGFVIPGWNLAADFRAGDNELYDFLEQLDAIVLGTGGKPYLAKDDYLTPQMFNKFFPKGNLVYRNTQKRNSMNVSRQIQRLFC